VNVLRRHVVRPALRPPDRALLAGLSRCSPDRSSLGSSPSPTPCSVGIGSWCGASGPTRSPQVARRSPQGPCRWSFAWPGRTRRGAIGGFMGSSRY
jgi:hypothetical protein